MKHKYTAKIVFEDGESLLNSANDIEELMIWINSQAESSFGQINGDIIDNQTQEVIKKIEYNPPE